MEARLLQPLIFMLVFLFHPALGAGEIVVGQVAPLNAADSPGSQLATGARVYFAAVNDRGGVHGNRLRLISRDRGLRPVEAILRTHELILTAEPIALIGLLGTGPMEELVRSQLLDQNALPVVGIRTGAASLRQPVHPFLFHTRAGYAEEIDKILTQLTTIGINDIGLFYEDSAFGAEGIKLVERGLTTRPQMKLLARASYSVGGIDTARAARELSDAKVKGIIAIANSFATASFYRDIRRIGGRAQVIALSVVDGAEVVRRIGPETAKGLIIAQVMPDPANRTIPLVKELHANFDKYGPSEGAVNQTVVEGYLAAKTLVEALRIAGPEPTRKKLKAALESMRYYDAGGVVVSFSPDNHTGTRFVDLAILIKAGKLMR